MLSFFKPTKFKVYFSITITAILLLLLLLLQMANNAAGISLEENNMRYIRSCCSKAAENFSDCTSTIGYGTIPLDTPQKCEAFIQDYERKQLFNTLSKVAFVAVFSLISFLISYFIASLLSFFDAYLKKR